MLQAFCAQTGFVCLFSNPYLFDYFLTSVVNEIKEACIISFVVMLHLICDLSFSVKLSKQICGKVFSQRKFRPKGL